MQVLEKKFNWLSVPHLAIYLIAGQIMVFIASATGLVDPNDLFLIPQRVFAGEYWRLVTFLFIPPIVYYPLLFFAWYLFYIMGSALEEHWGSGRFTLFIALAWLMTVVASFLYPWAPASNAFIAGSVFLAFAHLFPDFVLYIFFILPVRIRWLALITWVSYGWSLISGGWQTRLSILAAVGNYLLFFGSDIFWRAKSGRRQMERQVKSNSSKKEPYHRCQICGITDLSHPEMDFRYCPDCQGTPCYCRDHIFSHEHLQ
jgi:membrane associated rhomboid family serine protease